MLGAVISTRLRRRYGMDVRVWPAARLPDQITDMSATDYVGIDLDPGGRGQVRR